ncbi:hypothetical protein [Planctobacterium marinum]|uniref:Protein kinase domain-containing protein n=1 Tax=Planctobacterium marinum TaxID=1631968 RepID=A0AA48KRQ4_9ALTE|nr:hypothetical protein MACH26_18830 [Planctobacterium marinum]
MMEQIGKYRVIKLLGQGGFGAVYLAEHTKLHEKAAIKVFDIKDENLARLATSATSDASEVLNERFLNEARTLSKLRRNPHIVDIFDFDELPDGRPYYVMRYLPRTLKDELGSAESGLVDDKPVHEVQIKSFKLMSHEVTWDMYQPCIDAGVCTNSGIFRGAEDWGKDLRPVVNVSWNNITQ